MSLRVNTNVEAFNAHRNLAQHVDRRCRSRWRSCRAACASTARRTTPPAWRSPRACAPRSAARRRPAATRQDGISLVQTAEGALNEMHSILQRVRELAVQSANGTLSTTDHAKITAEVAQLTAELVRIRDSSTFNGIALFSSSATTTITIQVGANAEHRLGEQHEPRRRHHQRARLLDGLDGREPDRHRDQRRSRRSAPISAPSRTGSSTRSPTSASTRRT